jgi:hypothetical protein
VPFARAWVPDSARRLLDLPYLNMNDFSGELQNCNFSRISPVVANHPASII